MQHAFFQGGGRLDGGDQGQIMRARQPVDARLLADFVQADVDLPPAQVVVQQRVGEMGFLFVEFRALHA